MKEIWEKEFADDASLTLRLKKERAPIEFVPRAIVPIYEEFDWKKMRELSTRWIKIVKSYSRKTIMVGLLVYGFPAVNFFAGLFFLALGFSVPSYFLFAILFLLPEGLGIARAKIRFGSVEKLLPGSLREMKKYRRKIILLDFLVKFVVLYNIVKAKTMKSIEWRGRVYRL
jgi:cellulose synthase/poly-beta-1,6-N-acetylglucosamine synthase-like glycosyltransferase